jgi:NTP pyrophosphatase (non-canonical NTP hydrolase)
MKTEQYLLSRLTEECLEVGQENSKAINFGLDDHNPSDPDKVTNQTKLVDELNDVMGVIRLLVNTGAIPRDWQCDAKQTAKEIKVVKYFKYSQDRGRVDPDFKGESMLTSHNEYS